MEVTLLFWIYYSNTQQLYLPYIFRSTFSMLRRLLFDALRVGFRPARIWADEVGRCNWRALCHRRGLVQQANVSPGRARHRGISHPVVVPHSHLAHDHDTKCIVVGGQQRYVLQRDSGCIRSRGVVCGLLESVLPVRVHHALPQRWGVLEQVVFSAQKEMRNVCAQAGEIVRVCYWNQCTHCRCFWLSHWKVPNRWLQLHAANIN